jgi:hypothetical protein
MATKVMLMRHGEKPADDGSVQGVDLAGRRDENELSVRGWQRAGALARLFAPLPGQPLRAGLATPAALFAPAVGGPVRSRRSHHTLLPLAELLGTAVDTRIAKGDETRVAHEARLQAGAVLVCWSHQGLPAIARALTNAAVPAHWPEDRFDLVWVIDLPGGAFIQVPQLLLAGDRDEPAA